MTTASKHHSRAGITTHPAVKEQLVRDLADKVYEHLDQDGYGWAAGDGPTPEEVIGALYEMGALLTRPGERL